MDCIIFKKISLPLKVNGIVVTDCNGDYTIYINDRLTYDGAKKAAEHEMSHIVKNHHRSDRRVENDEAEARKEDIKIDKVLEKYTVL